MKDKPFAFTAVVVTDGHMVGRAVEGEQGYYPCGQFGLFEVYDDARAKADSLNETLGLSKKRAAEIVLSTMQRVR